MSENEIIDTPVTEVEYDPSKVYATIVLRDDGFHVIDEDGTEGPVCKLCDAEDKTIALTKNASNRQWFNRAKAEAEIAEKGHCDLYYKPTKKLGQVSRNTLPNAKLISYLPEELQAEYKAIIDRAIAAREADRKKPMTELEKAKARLAKAQAALAKLEAEDAE
jgi:hypothetical protein